MEREIKDPYTHVRIASAVEKGNSVVAERLMRKHVEWAKDNMIRLRIANGTEGGVMYTREFSGESDVLTILTGRAGR